MNTHAQGPVSVQTLLPGFPGQASAPPLCPAKSRTPVRKEQPGSGTTVGLGARRPCILPRGAAQPRRPPAPNPGAAGSLTPARPPGRAQPRRQHCPLASPTPTCGRASACSRVLTPLRAVGSGHRAPAPVPQPERRARTARPARPAQLGRPPRPLPGRARAPRKWVGGPRGTGPGTLPRPGAASRGSPFWRRPSSCPLRPARSLPVPPGEPPPAQPFPRPLPRSPGAQVSVSRERRTGRRWGHTSCLREAPPQRTWAVAPPRALGGRRRPGLGE